MDEWPQVIDPARIQRIKLQVEEDGRRREEYERMTLCYPGEEP